jgi:hypothetical protein
MMSRTHSFVYINIPSLSHICLLPFLPMTRKILQDRISTTRQTMNSTLLHIAFLLLIFFVSLISADIGAIANLTFYGLWLGAGPDAILTKVRLSSSPSRLVYKPSKLTAV